MLISCAANCCKNVVKRVYQRVETSYANTLRTKFWYILYQDDDTFFIKVLINFKSKCWSFYIKVLINFVSVLIHFISPCWWTCVFLCWSTCWNPCLLIAVSNSGVLTPCLMYLLWCGYLSSRQWCNRETRNHRGEAGKTKQQTSEVAGRREMFFF